MILAACGVPPEMLRQSDGTGRREAWRQFLFGSVAPVLAAWLDAHRPDRWQRGQIGRVIGLCPT